MKKMIVTKSIEIDMGHRVQNQKSKCRNLHGHRYKIEVGVDDLIIDDKGESDEGMVIDFGDLKEAMMNEINEVYDHAFILSVDDPLKHKFVDLKENGMKIVFVDFVPTAENLAKHWFYIMKKELERRTVSIKYVTVFETPTSSATYYEE